MWSNFQRRDYWYKINTHFYHHVMEYFIPKVCCDIIKRYVGDQPVHFEFEYDYSSNSFYHVYKHCTLGYAFFDEEDNDLSYDAVCRIKRCWGAL
jgi:hypothetical protein